MSRTLLAAAAVLAISTACYAAAQQSVDQRGLAFSVAQLTLRKGDWVQFNNSDATAHNILITGMGVRINGGLQQPGVSFRAPFMKAGVYQVTCGIHPRMKLAVTVQ
ncbi:MAG TPA: plastocyanin/azurin family copper-binding protein [Caulobacteraceae bacterium]|jgi:plastocyanin|nr:plastocyanin/azurin family copper-binding protein [Caulobacteraceae bacterium]